MKQDNFGQQAVSTNGWVLGQNSMGWGLFIYQGLRDFGMNL